VIKVVIIDDEPAAASLLLQMLERYLPVLDNVRIETSFDKALILVQNFKPDLVFLDVVMPPKTGFELLARLQERKFEVIFTTAYNEYAIQAIRFSALDYLLKPISPEELQAAVLRFNEKKKTKADSTLLYENLLQNLQQKESTSFRLAIPTVEKTWFISPSELIRCESESNYTWFYLTDNRKVLASKTMKEYEEILLQYNFLRIHKSHLVNKKYIDSFLNDGKILLTNKQELPVSRLRKQAVINNLSGKKHQ
jgi:two-component system, LytTR family, response regulator